MSSRLQILERAIKRLGSIWIVVLRGKYSITRFMSTKENELSACRFASSKSWRSNPDKAILDIFWLRDENLEESDKPRRSRRAHTGDLEAAPTIGFPIFGLL